jgi:hypothetical protein
MVKLTVMYTLPEGADHEAFLKWRTTEHQEENMGMPGVIKSDFYMVREAYTQASDRIASGKDKTSGDLPRAQKSASGGRLRAQPLRYRYITEAYWPDMERFKSAFFDSGYQERLITALERIADPLFLVSEEVLSAEN